MLILTLAVFAFYIVLGEDVGPSSEPDSVQVGTVFEATEMQVGYTCGGLVGYLYVEIGKDRFISHPAIDEIDLYEYPMVGEFVVLKMSEDGIFEGSFTSELAPNIDLRYERWRWGAPTC